MRQRRMLDYAYGIGLYILCQIGLFDLAEHTFVERSVGFGLSRKFLITDRGFVQSERGFFLSARCSIEIALAARACSSVFRKTAGCPRTARRNPSLASASAARPAIISDVCPCNAARAWQRLLLTARDRAGGRSQWAPRRCSAQRAAHRHCHPRLRFV